jgi:hypothetical protein
MRRIALALFVLLAGVAQAQHSVNLTWTASTDTGGTVNVYKAAAACPASGITGVTWTKLATAQPAGGPYTDSTVTAGQTVCYYVTAVVSGAESGPSNTGGGTVPINPPTVLVVVLH